MEQIRANRKFLCSIGYPLDGPNWVFCDNLAVVRSVSAPEQVLKKKHLTVAYRAACKTVVSGMIRILHIPSE